MPAEAGILYIAKKINGVIAWIIGAIIKKIRKNYSCQIFALTIRIIFIKMWAIGFIDRMFLF